MVKITLLRVIPTMTFIHFVTGKSSDIHLAGGEKPCVNFLTRSCSLFCCHFRTEVLKINGLVEASREAMFYLIY